MTSTRRPRVAAIGLDDRQVASIEPLCGELRPAHSWDGYLLDYSWTETDVIVSSDLGGARVNSSVNLMTIGSTSLFWSDMYSLRTRPRPHFANTKALNTERELAVSPAYPRLYRPLSDELSKQLSRAAEPPDAIETSRKDCTALIETTSGRPVALRLDLPTRSSATDGRPSTPVALLLPAAADLVAWFRTFLCDVHESDPGRVPQLPPRLSQPSDWYTLKEKELADRISAIDAEIEGLTNERDQIHSELAAEGERADKGIRRAIWADGDELIAAVAKVLANLGFVVRDMDAELTEGEPKSEDLRLTREGVNGWEAMVEVKGYTSGTRTNDARQIREHRERYMLEEGRQPDLTLWVANPFRTMDPSSRPAPDRNVQDAAANVGAVHVLASDLYRQWTLVAAGSLDKETVVQSLVNADPGLWSPPVLGSDT